SIQEIERHIDNVRLQLQFFNEALEATDHRSPDWLATELISLRNKSGRLQDDMQRFKEQLESKGLKKVGSSNKRLSLEGSKPSSRPPDLETSINPSTSPAPSQNARQSPRPQRSEDSYVAQHIDVTEEVNRRLRESRLRRLMDSPSTSQKRKRDAFDDTRMGNGGDSEGAVEDDVDIRRTPTKKLRASGSFEPALKRKENGATSGSTFKRRKIWPDTT
ncbi:hypothetical protein K458DRAFT_290663, partial [Lentithecium fluviatile CBS 122367]